MIENTLHPGDLDVVTATGYDPQIARLPHPQRFIASMARLLKNSSAADYPFYELTLGKELYGEVAAEILTAR